MLGEGINRRVNDHAQVPTNRIAPAAGQNKIIVFARRFGMRGLGMQMINAE
jgi:hypothetical protein